MEVERTLAVEFLLALDKCTTAGCSEGEPKDIREPRKPPSKNGGARHEGELTCDRDDDDTARLAGEGSADMEEESTSCPLSLFLG